jgi:hypothetical protein
MMPNLMPPPTLWQKARAYLFLRRFRKTPLGRALANHTHHYFYGADAPLGRFEESRKQQMITGFYQQILSLSAYSNPFLKFREIFANYVVGYADIQVLSLTPEQKAGAHYSNAKYISADLRRHIRQCCAHNDEMNQLLWEQPDMSDEDLLGGAHMRAAVWLYFANGFNMVRSEFEPINEARDWYRPFLTSAMIFAENNYRSDIGLASLIPDDFGLLALQHSTFMGEVANGTPNPLQSWETHYGITHSENI